MVRAMRLIIIRLVDWRHQGRSRSERKPIESMGHPGTTGSGQPTSLRRIRPAGTGSRSNYLMLYRMRLKNGSIDSHSNGKWIGSDGATIDLGSNDFQLDAVRRWASPVSHAVYPVSWKLSIPKLGLDLELSPAIDNQELNVAVLYWEGAIRIKGACSGKPVDGVGYMELTGYEGEAPGLAGSAR